MALFPAYQPTPDESLNEPQEQKSESWLQNESCPPEISVVKIDPADAKTSDSFSSEVKNETKLKKRHDHTRKDGGPRRKKKRAHKRKKPGTRDGSNSPNRRKKRKPCKSAHKKQPKGTQNSSSACDHSSAVEEHLVIPTHDGSSKNIFTDAPLRTLKAEEAMYFDTLPDKNNSIFCNTHYSQLSKYSKLSPLPLGISAWLYFKGKSKKKKLKRYFSKGLQKHEFIPVIRLTDFEADKEYIPINLSYGKGREKWRESQPSSSTSSRLGILDSSTEDYVQGREMTSADEDVPSQENPEKKYWQDRIKFYNEKLSKEPENISLWLEFIDIQDKAIAYIFDGDDKKVAKGKSTKLLTERKISVLESAINKNVHVLDLQLRRLRLGEDIWNNSKLSLEWNKLASSFPNDIKMWYNYITFYLTYFTIFDLDRSVKAISKCQERLLQMQRGTFVSHKPPENIGTVLIDLTTQLAFVWCQGGYMERSIALFQALIELNLFASPELKKENVEMDSVIDVFEAFWDSKAPRFGEEGAVGWGNFMKERKTVEFPEEIVEGTQDEEDEILKRGEAKHKLWLQVEASRELNHWLPWQRDPDLCEDLERMVSFSMIRQHMFLTTSDEENFYLLVQFLSFLGIPISSDLIPSSLETSIFRPLRLETLQSLIPVRDLSGESFFDFPVIGASIRKPKSESYFTFVCDIVHRSIAAVSSAFKPKLVILLVKLYILRCTTLRERGDDHLQEAVVKCKESLKNLLRETQYRGDLNIYFEFAQFEASVGCAKEALKIYAKALKLGLSQNTTEILSSYADSEVLWRHLSALVLLQLEAAEAIQQETINNILNICCYVLLDNRFLSSGKKPNGAHVLRAKNKLSSFVEAHINGAQSDSSANHVNVLSYSVTLLAIFQLLTLGFKPACLIYEAFFSKLKQRKLIVFYSQEILNPNQDKSKSNSFNFIEEKVYENYLRIISLGRRVNHIFPCLPMSPSSVREILKSAIAVTPNNLVFLQKLIKYQNWRDILCGHFDFYRTDEVDVLVLIFRLLPHVKTVTTMIASAEYGAMSSGHKLENVLERAVSTACGKNCPLLWRIYLRLIQAIRPNQLKSVAYRALNNCPSAKCLYMDCIELCPDTISDVLRLMGEKKIRVRLPLEELEVLLEEEKEETEEMEEGGVDEKDAMEDKLIVDEDSENKKGEEGLIENQNSEDSSLTGGEFQEAIKGNNGAE